MAISSFERAIDIQIADMQKREGLAVTVDLSKPVKTNQQIRKDRLTRQLSQNIKTINGSFTLAEAVSNSGQTCQLRKEQE